MAPLGMVVLVQSVRGSYGVAGIVTGAFAVGTAAGAPMWGRAMDRHGQARVILPTVLTSAALIAVLSIGAVNGLPNAALVALAGLAGSTFPPFSAAMRSTWRVVLPDGPLRRAGFALDAVSVESMFVGGPLILSLLLVISSPVVPLLVTAALLAAGGVAYCCTEPARRSAVETATGVSTRTRETATGLMSARLTSILAISAAMAIGFGIIDTSLAATARQILGNARLLGLLFASIAGASVIGGLFYGTRATHDREHRRLPIALAIFAAGLAPVSILLRIGRPSLWALMPLLFVAGLAIAPALIMLQGLVDRAAPPDRNNEAQAWLSTSSTTGGAAGTAAAGLVIDAYGVPASLAAAVFAVLLSCVLALYRSGRAAADTGVRGAHPDF